MQYSLYNRVAGIRFEGCRLRSRAFVAHAHDPQRPFPIKLVRDDFDFKPSLAARSYTPVRQRFSQGLCILGEMVRFGSPQRGPRLSNLSLERFRTSTKYQDRPAAADIAYCVAAFANGMTEDRIERALEDDYLSRDPSTSKRAAYIRRTMEKARRWAER